jgi:hypothetical protein
MSPFRTILIVASTAWFSACGDEFCHEGDVCECSGTGACAWECEGGNCTFSADGSGAATFVCGGGGCTVDVSGTGAVTVECPEGGCTVTADGAGSMAMDCAGGDCAATCDGTMACSISECADCACEATVITATCDAS